MSVENLNNNQYESPHAFWMTYIFVVIVKI